MNVLVTGGAGFIGSHLAKRLAADDGRVTVLDDLTKGRKANIEHLINHEGFEFVLGDLRDKVALRNISERGPFDAIYHLAAIHYIPECVSRPVDTLSTNVVGTQSLLAAVEFRRFVFASTADVYSSDVKPHREAEPPKPNNIYGLSKFFAERLLEVASEGAAQASFVIARLFNVYGSGETNPHLIPRIIQEIRTGNGIRLGNLWPRRDYTYVEDTVDALVELERMTPSSRIETFNVGTGETASVEEVVMMFEDILGISLPLRMDNERARAFDRPHLQADTRKIQEATGWRPNRSLREGLKELCVIEGLLP